MTDAIFEVYLDVATYIYVYIVLPHLYEIGIARFTDGMIGFLVLPILPFDMGAQYFRHLYIYDSGTHGMGY